MLNLLGWLFSGIGTLVILIAAVGLLRLPDALSRQHAATKAGTVAAIMFAIGAAMIIQDHSWTWRLAVMVILLLFTLPLASHALSRAAACELADKKSS